MKITCSLFFAIILASLIPANKVNAEGEFETQYDVQYDVQSSGITKVNYNITIINNRSDVVATKYSLSLKQTVVNNIKSFDKKGEIEVSKSNEGDIVTITTVLRDQLVGINKKNNFNLTFDTPNIATKVGEIWNINIPQVQGIESTGKYEISLKVPESFGPEIYISPQKEETLSGTNRVYTYTKNDLLESGISASYGKYQVLNYNLKYELTNESPFSVIREIALPPDINRRQKVFYTSLTPQPFKVIRDKDGNILAQYRVKSKDTLEVSLIGSARIMGEQIQTEFGGSFADIPPSMVRDYTKGQKFWETDSSVIKKIADNLKDNNKNVVENAHNIYNFVIQNLQYDFEIEKSGTVERRGALQALSEPNKAACMEFTDLFIAISRAMGIPAREINGYAFSTTGGSAPISVNLNGGDVLHAWPEYYDPNFGWIAVDPTWGATSKTDYFTKLDTNHFAFVVKGFDPEYPVPAGSYKLDDGTNTVDISFSDSSNPIKTTDLDDLSQAQAFISVKKGMSLLIPLIIGIAILTVFSVYFTLSRRIK